MKRGYNLITLEPDITVSGSKTTAHGGADVLFDWIAVEVPTGAFEIKTISGTIMGTDGAVANEHDLHLYYAKSINGIAPTSFGTGHAVNTEDLTAAFRRNILGFTFIDTSSVDDSDQLRAYSALGMRSQSSADGIAEGSYNSRIILEGEPNITRTGFQTIYIAGLTRGAFDFGTEIDLNMAASANVDADTTGASIVLTTSGTDPRHVFQVGDEVIAQDGAEIGKITAVVNATSIKVDQVKAALTNADTINWKYPLEFIFGFEY